jgi:hypothetical protein
MLILSPEYIAGLFDGEGYISIRESNTKRNNRKLNSFSVCCQAGIGMTTKIVYEIAEMFGTWTHEENRSIKGHKSLHRVVFSSKDSVKEFLEFIYPFLIVKKRQAKVALAYIKSNPTSPYIKRTEFQIKKSKQAIRIIRKLNK